MSDGVVTPMFNRQPRVPSGAPIERAADSANSLFEENRKMLGEYLASFALRDDQLPYMLLVPNAELTHDHYDGIVHAVRSDPKLPIVVISDNLVRFFERNGAGEESTRNATLYAAAVGFAVSALSTRSAGLNSGFDSKRWGHIGVREPRRAAPYRFAAGALNGMDRGIPSGLKAGGKPLAIHAASFADPMKKPAIRDLAAPYFKTH